MYKQIYFRINTPSYYPKNQSWVGFNNQEDSQQFHNTALNLFLNDGWKLKEDGYKGAGSCDRIMKDKQELYLHPQSFSGVVLEENIPYIEQLINNSNVFKYERTDIYEDVFDITDEEYLSILESKKQYIEQDILETYKTKRSNLYITDTWSCLNRVLDKYRIKRLSHYIGVISSSNKDVQYIYEVFEKLVEQGEIIIASTKHGIGYRTKTKKDKKIA